AATAEALGEGAAAMGDGDGDGDRATFLERGAAVFPSADCPRTEISRATPELTSNTARAAPISRTRLGVVGGCGRCAPG
ncbi:MAG: hypothetical protein WCB04_05245, partial [Mycobacteriales bacterium]